MPMPPGGRRPGVRRSRPTRRRQAKVRGPLHLERSLLLLDGRGVVEHRDGRDFRQRCPAPGLAAQQQRRALDVDVFRATGGESRRWFRSWGEAIFDPDAEGRFASARLANGKTVSSSASAPCPIRTQAQRRSTAGRSSPWPWMERSIDAAWSSTPDSARKARGRLFPCAFAAGGWRPWPRSAAGNTTARRAAGCRADPRFRGDDAATKAALGAQASLHHLILPSL